MKIVSRFTRTTLYRYETRTVTKSNLKHKKLPQNGYPNKVKYPIVSRTFEVITAVAAGRGEQRGYIAAGSFHTKKLFGGVTLPYLTLPSG